uniref:Uncharacterized protein n=1 Tax=Dunaliella tertiolecta TaxID=3047 RepID=A0A7S3VKS9_DUNTE
MAPVATEGGARARAGCVSPHPACNPLPWLLPVLSLDPSATAKPSHSLSSLCHEPFCGGWPTRLTGGGGYVRNIPVPGSLFHGQAIFQPSHLCAMSFLAIAGPLD